MSSPITYSDAIDGYFLYAESCRRSPHTLADYTNTFAKFGLYIGIKNPPELTAPSVKRWIAGNSQVRRIEAQNLNDLWQIAIGHNLIDNPILSDIPRQTVEGFLRSFKLSKKTILNYHVALSALWRWAEKDGLTDDNIMRQVDPPKPQKKIVHPYSEDEIRRFLAACKQNAPYRRAVGNQITNNRHTQLRDTAIILLLLDSGLRANELCALNTSDVDFKQHRVTVRSGKGGKGRATFFSARAGRILWKYSRAREDQSPEAPMFATANYTRLSRSGLLQFVRRAGERGGVPGANVHRFRHTFAIQSLRNGMNPYVLQDLLGHSTMDMVRRYLRLAEVDLSTGHGHASPVDNWRL